MTEACFWLQALPQVGSIPEFSGPARGFPGLSLCTQAEASVPLKSPGRGWRNNSVSQVLASEVREDLG